MFLEYRNLIIKYMQNGVVEYKQKLTNTLLNASSIKDLLANNKNLPHQQFVTFYKLAFESHIPEKN